MKRILVTGGAGFIGSHLCERLLARGDEVLCVDNYFTSRRQNIRHLFGKTSFEFMRHDVTWPLYVEVDQIYNLACPASPVHYQFDPVQTTKTSVHGAINMLGLAKRLKARILQSSTSEVYGDPKEHPQKETYWGNVNPIGPRACYDAETEILTEEGWVPFPMLRHGTAVATLTGQGEVEYHVPDEIITYPYVGELVRFSGPGYDLTVTPNHRIYARYRQGSSKFLEAGENRNWPAWKIPVAADFKAEEIEWVEFGEARDARTPVDRVRMDDWLEFLGYYLSEGYVDAGILVCEASGRNYDIGDYNVLMSLPEGNVRDRMTGCLDRLGFEYFPSDDHRLRICGKRFARFLAPVGKADDRYIPREYLDLSLRQSKILLHALIRNDGAFRGENACYWTRSEHLADDVQELALRCGYSASKSLAPGRDIHRVTIRRSVEAELVEPERILYAGRVYCVNVKNHVICVRRHGKAAFC
ncbi:MAG: rfbB, partial [Deltaproteobacteria bacterium]|nr:rfbB [Deltaproteobacteria bacterium]